MGRNRGLIAAITFLIFFLVLIFHLVTTDEAFRPPPDTVKMENSKNLEKLKREFSLDDRNEKIKELTEKVKEKNENESKLRKEIQDLKKLLEAKRSSENNEAEVDQY